MTEPTQTPDDRYDQYAVNDDYKVAISRVDYEVLTKEVLVRLQDLLEQDTFDNATAINLTKTALDYLVYLEDNRRVII